MLPTSREPEARVIGDPATGDHKAPILLRYWMMLEKRRWLVAAILGGCLLAGLALTLLQTPKYSAETRVEISRAQDNVTDVEAVTPQEFNQDLEFYQTQYALMQSRSLATRVVRKLNLAGGETLFAAFDHSFEGQESNVQSGTFSRSQLAERNQVAADLLLNNIGISPVRGSALVDIRFTSPDPLLSKNVANAWAEAFIQSNLDRRFASSKSARDFLQNRLIELKDRLEESERNLVGYASESGIVTLSSQESADGRTRSDRTLTIADIEALNAELAAATADRVRAESRLKGGIDQAVISNETINGLNQKRAELAAEYSRMNTQFDTKYPPLKALANQIARLDSAIASQRSDIRQSAQTTYAQSVSRERDLRSRVNDLRSKLVGEQRNSIQYNIYQREVDTNRQLYDGLLQRFKEIGVAGVGTNNISIVDSAEVPEKPSSPSLILNLLVSMILGAALAGGILFTLEHIDQSVKSPDDVKELGLPLLGVIPRETNSDILAELRDRKSAIGEAYLSAQTNLSFLTDSGVPGSILLTSTRPGEGKSTSAMALAIMLARTGKETILIDADIRSPSINGMFDLENTVGLSNFLSGQNDLQALTFESGDPGLTILPAGPPVPNAAELLSGKRFSELITLLESQFDVVVVDGPPILGLADVPLLSREVDGVIYAIETDGVKMGGIKTALNRLHVTNANIFGAIVTKYVPDGFRGRDDYGYGYGYGMSASKET